MGKVDLHLHSCISDGKYTPPELVAKAAGAGLTVIALTDHDNVDGIAPALEAAKKFPQLKVIPGVEISTDEPEGEVHMLGYFIDYTNPELLASLVKSRDSRYGRAQEMVNRLASLGLPVEWKRVQEIAGDGTIGRPHIAQALLEKGYIATIREAFDRYIGYGGPAYVEREKIDPAEAVGLILRAGGLPVLAHPLTTKDPEALVARLKKSGLAGIEAYYGEHTPEQIERLLSLAEKHRLVATGGSDFHGLDENAETRLGSVDVPLSAVEGLIALAEQRVTKQPAAGNQGLP
ncbi:MAG: PHP domain-containing protein [Chloroflexi bacterium]|nr:PHP domain-containing protein [Chloroflexota bacterium]